MDLLAPSPGTTPGRGTMGASSRWRAQQLEGLAASDFASVAELAGSSRSRARQHGHLLRFLEELEAHSLAPSGQ